MNNEWKPIPASLYNLILTGDLESLLWKLKGVHEAEEVRMALYNARQAILAAEEYEDCTPPASAQDDAKDERALVMEAITEVWDHATRIDDATDEVIDILRPAPAAGDALDAERWRAFIGCARIRPLGSAGLEQPDPNYYAHMGLEIWTVYGRDYSPELLERMDVENERGRRWLVMFADVARAAIAQQSVRKGE